MFDEYYGDGCVFLRHRKYANTKNEISTFLIALWNTRENRDLIRRLSRRLNDLK